MTGFSLPRRLGLSSRLLLFIVVLVTSVVATIDVFLIRRQLADLRAMAESKKEVMRAGLRKKGMMLVQSLTLTSQRALVVRDYLFLYEAVKAAVSEDEEIIYGIIMDRSRRALVHSDRKQASRVLDGPAARFAAAATTVSVQEVTIDGVRNLEALAPIVVGKKPWGTFRLGLSLRNLDRAVQASEQAIRAKITHSILVAVGSALLILLLGVLGGIFVIRRMVLHPLDALGAGVRKVRAGDLDHALEIGAASREWVELAHAFNEMSGAISQRNHELAELNRQLEQRVADRTQELSQANAHLSEENARRREAEKELHRYAHQLRQSNRDLSDFAYVASHDLKEPLRKVETFGNRLQQKYHDELGDKGQDYLGRMLNAAGRMRSLITELLEFSRVTTKARPFAPVDLSAVIAGVLSDLEVAIEAEQAEVVIGELPEIMADEFQMRQLFQNLLGNALKFQQEGLRPRVQISASSGHVESEGEQIPCHRIMVEDNGIGFDQEHAEKIFGVFQRLHGRSQYEGTGMGLAICRKIAERHGGTITAHSAPGDGATFIISIPVAPEQVAGAVSMHEVAEGTLRAMATGENPDGKR